MNLQDALTKLAQDQVASLINGNAVFIADALAESEDGKASFSVGCKLTLVGQRVYCASKLGMAKRHTDETESESIELQQQELPMAQEPRHRRD